MQITIISKKIKTTKDMEEKKINQMSLANCDLDEVRCVNSITDDIMINQITNKVSVIKFKPDVCDNQIELQLGDYEIEVRDGKTYAVKKKPIYPTTYVDCCKVIGCRAIIGFTGLDDEEENLYGKFIALKRCRDAYWKIAGEQMGLGKPWKPNFNNNSPKHNILNSKNKVMLNDNKQDNRILTFPTIEMRNAFFDNFRDLIEQCKELL